MDKWKTENIRNVAILGHGSCGKTTLVEALAYTAGVTERLGRVEEGNTISDYDKEEIKRLFSIHTSIVPIQWKSMKINLLDTPGYFDFAGEVEEAMYAADAAIIVVSGKSGVEVGTRKAWDLCERLAIPRMFFVTDMDDSQTDFGKIVRELTGLYGKKIAPFHLPIRENGEFTGFVNVVKRKGRTFIKNSEYKEREIPEEAEEELNQYRELLLEAVAETDEVLLEKYFNGEAFTQEEISHALRASVHENAIVPILMGSGVKVQGTTMLLQAIEKYFPKPEANPVIGIDQKKREEFIGDFDSEKPMTAQVFKTIADPFIGKFSLVKVYSGILKSDTSILNVSKGAEEKLSRLYVLRGKEQIQVDALEAGDIGAIAKMSSVVTGDSLAAKEAPVLYEPFTFSKPYTYVRYEAAKEGDDDKISQALQKLLEEDKTLKIEHDVSSHQTLLYGMGDQHIEVALSKLFNRYKVELNISKPRVPYRETIRKRVSVQGKYKKQSGGHGQYADVHMDFEPLNDLEQAYQFDECIFGGAVPKNYFPAVEKGVVESLAKGPLAGYPVVGIHATLTDGSYHPVDSSELAFKMAAIQAFRQGFMEASPVLLEPVVSLKVVVPDKFTGDVMGDLNKRRGKVLGISPVKNKQEITADIPLSEVFGYSVALRSMTGGYGEFSYEFARYEQASQEVQEKVVKESKEQHAV
ncbi:elongation factor G [[Clostridium] polysaccharolyticum]|uniref:Elongation factor G n=1 Tax=[Clostridium] polysaccharolyticum TaxID=29364 RepID=A0A1H9Y0A7_9FIRM|nr:elongation factor G [[Clostridium] polysaccharolyticum]SES62050.1 elongation factor G [[Clostridium] polysaccharolyticum]